MVGAAGLLVNSSMNFVGGRSGFSKSKQALKEGTTSSREVLDTSMGRKRLVAL